MPRVPWANNGEFTREDAENTETGFSEYTGKTPPKGSYICKVRQLSIKYSFGPKQPKEGTPMLTCVFEIAEPKKSPRAKYNGYGFWQNLLVNKQNVGRINIFLKALGFDPKAWWSGKSIVEDDDYGDRDNPNRQPLLKIGPRKVTGEEMVVVSAKFTPAKPNPKGGVFDEKLEATGFSPYDPKAKPVEEEPEDEDEDEPEDDEDEFDEEEDEDEEEEEEEDDEYEDDEDEDDEDDEDDAF